jgi:hypothetical protein
MPHVPQEIPPEGFVWVLVPRETILRPATPRRKQLEAAWARRSEVAAKRREGLPPEELERRKRNRENVYARRQRLKLEAAEAKAAAAL